MVRTFSRVILFLTSHLMVNDVLPNLVATIPISIISPCFGAEIKLISEMKFGNYMWVFQLNYGIQSCFFIDPL